MFDKNIYLKKPEKLKRMTEKNLRTLRSAYKACSDDTPFSNWLSDNYHIFSRAGAACARELAASKALPSDKKTALPLVFLELSDYAKDSLPDDLSLMSALSASGRKLGEREFLALPFVLISVYIWRAAQSVKNRDEAELSLAVKSIRSIDDVDFEKIILSLSETERILSKDPAGVYENMASSTKSYYRKTISSLAEKAGLSESEFAGIILKKAQSASDEKHRHVGAYLTKREKKYSLRGRSAIAFYFIFPLVFSLLISSLLSAYYLIPIIYFPLWAVLKNPVDTIFLKDVPPTVLPRMNAETADAKMRNTLITVSTLLPNSEKSGELYGRFEQLFLTSGRSGAYFCALADLKAAPEAENADDEANISAARRAFRKLNEKYGERFFLLIRRRTYSKTQECFCGRERKRGAITELVNLIKDGSAEPFKVCDGDMKTLREIEYIIALDGDTCPSLSSVQSLVAAAVHPLNQPEIDEEKRTVKDGYGIISPRVGTTLEGMNQTPFSKIMTGGGGIEAYNTVCSDLYQDLFSEGIFAGKGLINVNAFYTVLDDLFEDETVLSHDILEGCFLRAALQSDALFYDGFPKNFPSWFDRAHRWIRGDLQNVRWIFGRVRTKKGKIKNPLSFLSRFKLFDNIRRAATPVIALAGLFLSLAMPKSAALACGIICVLSACSGNLRSAVRSFISGGFYTFSARYYSGVLPSALSSLVCAFINIMMLAKSAFLSLDAAIRVCYRMRVSRKNLLQWVVSAEAGGDGGLFKTVLTYAPCVITGALFLIFGSAPLKLFGILTLIFPAFAILSGRAKKEQKNKTSYHEREKLVGYAAATWKYYDEYCTAEDNFLPPDNVEESPVYKIAHRTSPTNIGLMLLSVLAARDFGFIDTDSMCFRIDKALGSVEKAEKYRGNLYNWYDTKTLKPLKPEYVSTVDSGNFLCCLTALKEGIKEYGAESGEIKSICGRIENILAETDLSFLFNKRRKLFHIGFDARSGELTNSYYDLLMSEARMTSYYAIADGGVSPEHWGALGRPLSRQSGYMGAVSWTGTTFEYFMPNLLLPSYRGTLSYESLKFCVLCQKKRARGKSPVWGISESGYYAFDDELNYQYKAFGVQKLGLKRDLDEELVISPYSSFLTLGVSPSTSLRNLSKAQKLGLYGRLGFYEAADFTRNHGNCFSIVKSYMAHHVGMSFLAVANLLKDNVMQKRFMSDGRMRSASSLLTERIPTGGVILKTVKRIKDEKGISRYKNAEEENKKINPLEPVFYTFSNGESSVILSDTGLSVSVYKNTDMTVRTVDYLNRPRGVFAFFKNGETRICVSEAPCYTLEGEHRFVPSSDGAEYLCKTRSAKLGMKVKIHELLPCEAREITLTNISSKPLSGDVYLCFTPCLAEFNDYLSHPAFSEVMISSDYNAESKAAVFKRKKGRDGKSSALAVGMLGDDNFSYETVRSDILIPSLGTKGLADIDLAKVRGGLTETDACCVIKVRVNIQPRGSRKFTVLLAFSETPETALKTIENLRREKKFKSAKSAFVKGELDTAIVKKLLPCLLLRTRVFPRLLPTVRQNMRNKTALWKFGISGDLPAVALFVNNADEVYKTAAYLSAYEKLKRSFIAFDLVIIYRETGGYEQTVRDGIMKYIAKSDAFSVLGKKGGIHLIDTAACDSDELCTLASFCVSMPESDSGEPEEQKKIREIHPAKKTVTGNLKADVKNFAGEFKNGRFKVCAEPGVPWCNVHANEKFGTLVSHCSLGFTWAVNSRENRLTPSYNDSSFDNTGERLLVKKDGRIYDLIRVSSVSFGVNETVWKSEIDSVELTVKVSVPKNSSEKLIEVKAINNSSERADFLLTYCIEPVLDFDRRDSKFLIAEETEKGLLIKNTFGGIGGEMTVCERNGIDFFTCSMKNVLSGDFETNDLLPQSEGCALVGKRAALLPSESKTFEFYLSYSDGTDFETNTEKSDNYAEIRVNTGDRELDEMINYWLPKQIIEGRLYARTGFYQSSGAFGFRDQLQDVCALTLLKPETVKNHILRASSKQFAEGDVLHWWHELPGGIRGVRTRYSDDLLFLPYAACLYSERSGDFDIFSEKTPFLSGEELKENETERYCEYSYSENTATLFEHCLKACLRAEKYGEHGLALIGSGDWNDGFNRVGRLGRGESVWLTQFQIIVFEKFSNLCEKLGEREHAKHFSLLSEKLRSAVDGIAWDGDRYIRAFCDDGEPLGAKTSTECVLDSLAQSFASLSDMPDKSRVNTALDTAMRELVDREYGVVRLLKEGFDGKKDAGYIESYPVGIRENGGQYTHAACWLAMALFRESRNDEGYEILKILNPVKKYSDKKTAEMYKKDPCYLAGDVYYSNHSKGLGGWSVYTGAAAWYYRTAVEEMLGIKQISGKIFVYPRLPLSMDGYEARIRINGAEVQIKAVRGKNKGMTVDGKKENFIIPDGRNHTVTVML